MGKALGMRCVWGLCGVLAGALLVMSVAQAEVSPDLSGSVVVYPKVVSNEARDTVLQLTNTSNNLVHVQCFYVNAAPLDPSSPAGPGNPRQWQVTDFTLWLTRQQPIHWVASQGRAIDPSDGFGNDGSGLDAGAVPPVPPGFEGELKCVQTTAGGDPFGGNSLKGEAVLRRTDGDVSKYNAIAILADPDRAAGDPATRLDLDSTPNHDGEYASCANTLMLDHFLDGAENVVIEELNNTECPEEGDCPIRTELTLVPCSQDFENILPSRSTVQFAITNELEQNFSASTTVDCWLTVRLADIDAPTGSCTGATPQSCVTDQDCIDAENGFCNKNSVFSLGNLGTGTAFSRITPVGLDGGVIGVAEETMFNQSAQSAQAAWNLQQEGNRYDATSGLEGGPVVDHIVIPSSGF